MEGRRYSQELGCGASRSVSGAPSTFSPKTHRTGFESWLHHLSDQIDEFWFLHLSNGIITLARRILRRINGCPIRTTFLRIHSVQDTVPSAHNTPTRFYGDAVASFSARRAEFTLGQLDCKTPARSHSLTAGCSLGSSAEHCARLARAQEMLADFRPSEMAGCAKTEFWPSMKPCCASGIGRKPLQSPGPVPWFEQMPA